MRKTNTPFTGFKNKVPFTLYYNDLILSRIKLRREDDIKFLHNLTKEIDLTNCQVCHDLLIMVDCLQSIVILWSGFYCVSLRRNCDSVIKCRGRE